MVRKHTDRDSNAAARGDAGKSGTRPAPARATRRHKSASPSNTALSNYTGDTVRVLRSGIDSLYLSYQGELSPASETRLTLLKDMAQSDDPKVSAEAILISSNHRFEVMAAGKGKYPFVIRDNWFHIQLSRATARELPMAYCQIGSELLTLAGYQEAIMALGNVVAGLGKIGPPKISRFDIFCDFTTTCDFDVIPRTAWVRRAKKFAPHYDGDQLTGFSFGQGGSIVGRLYNKTLELTISGKDYLKPLWQKAGWNGSDTVWRLEFQLRRESFGQMVGLTYQTLPELLPSFWRYLTEQWLKLTFPSLSDRCKSRWPVHPVWQQLGDLSFDVANIQPISRITKERLPDDRFLFTNGLGAITSYMAREGIKDFDTAVARYCQDAYRYHSQQSERTGATLITYVLQKAREKAKRFNVAFDKGEQ